jgi:hypothetical protein
MSLLRGFPLQERKPARNRPFLYCTDTTTSVEIWLEPEFPRTEMV